jgi:hypothetical protein
MAITFPASPNIGDQYTVGSSIWEWNGSAWIVVSGALQLSNIDLDGGTDIGAALVDADLILVDDGAAGTNRKSRLSRVWTYIGAKIAALTDISTWASVLDEDDMASDSAAAVPTQQSVAAFVRGFPKVDYRVVHPSGTSWRVLTASTEYGVNQEAASLNVGDYISIANNVATASAGKLVEFLVPGIYFVTVRFAARNIYTQSSGQVFAQFRFEARGVAQDLANTLLVVDGTDATLRDGQYVSTSTFFLNVLSGDIGTDAAKYFCLVLYDTEVNVNRASTGITIQYVGY